MYNDLERKLRIVVRNLHLYTDVFHSRELERKTGRPLQQLIPLLEKLADERRIELIKDGTQLLIKKVKENPHKEPDRWW
ncbi:hypothetical protein [Aureibacillus halotolerans]|uniref:Uncharacterized protein n=1 Tax=Aureibacillus halotolerans TaxID=1508390 RepID=A0A4R6TWL8_9BACI|nr:hypothetical protein [Aureibacillus halotolerans]TDQ36235.1 hypothetical protein EV213_11924 [Aureibacillus halotolerans]